jgi:hypothetical protein
VFSPNLLRTQTHMRVRRGEKIAEGARKWIDTSADEMRIFISILVYMRVFRQASVEE